jgi:hypothetical protein
MKTGWFKNQLSIDGVAAVTAAIWLVWYMAGLNYKVEANGKVLKSVAKTQVGVLKCLQQTKEVLQAQQPTNRLDIIVIPDPPT